MARRTESWKKRPAEAGEGTWDTRATRDRRGVVSVGDRRGGRRASVASDAVGLRGSGRSAGDAEDADAATWRSTFDTNVLGASLVTARPCRLCSASAGTALYLSDHWFELHVAVARLGPLPGHQGGARSARGFLACRDPGIGFTRATSVSAPGGEGDARTQFNNDWGPHARVRWRGVVRGGTTCPEG